jgi:hypothetical protein
MHVRYPVLKYAVTYLTLPHLTLPHITASMNTLMFVKYKVLIDCIQVIFVIVQTINDEAERHVISLRRLTYLATDPPLTSLETS